MPPAAAAEAIAQVDRLNQIVSGIFIVILILAAFCAVFLVRISKRSLKTQREAVAESIALQKSQLAAEKRLVELISQMSENQQEIIRLLEKNSNRI